MNQEKKQGTPNYNAYPGSPWHNHEDPKGYKEGTGSEEMSGAGEMSGATQNFDPQTGEPIVKQNFDPQTGESVVNQNFDPQTGQPIANQEPVSQAQGGFEHQEYQTYTDDEMPEEMDRWNWGAFIFNIWWGIGNRTYLALITLVPFIGWIFAIVLGIQGNKWAWKNSKTKNKEAFIETQKSWNRAGFWAFIVSIVMFIVSIIFSFIIIAATVEIVENMASTYADEYTTQYITDYAEDYIDDYSTDDYSDYTEEEIYDYIDEYASEYLDEYSYEEIMEMVNNMQE